ncbi:MAG: DUF4446 family protein [Candidatus Krumholzibacteriia bacterium]
MSQDIFSYLSSHSGPYLLAALLLGSVAAVAAVALLVRMRSLLRPFARVRAETDDPAHVLPAVLALVEKNESRVEDLATELAAHLAESRFFVRHVGLVRYDAFGDIAGQQSYSMCLLDSRKNGVVLTYLTSKGSTRGYAVTMRDGEPHRQLSDDETRAVDAALSGDALVTEAR